MCEIGWQIQRLIHFYASKFQKFPLIHKITFQGVSNTGSKRMTGE